MSFLFRDVPLISASVAGRASGRTHRRVSNVRSYCRLPQSTRSCRGSVRWSWLVAIALLVVFAGQAYLAARQDSVTIDEFVHVPVGLYTLYNRDFSIDPINPPWARALAALPLLADPPAFAPEPGAPHWGMGYELMRRNAESYQAIFVRARSAVIVMALLLGLVVFAWARELYDDRAAWVALALFAFSPNLLAHGHLVTLDLAGALGFVGSCYTAWRLIDKPGVGRALLVGVVMGLATLLKLSGFVLVAAIVGALLFRVVANGRAVADRYGLIEALGHVVAMGVAAIVTVNVGYGFDGTFAPLSGAKLDPKGVLFAVAESAPWLRLPLPEPFINGVDMVLNVGKAREPSYFLAGELSSEGWWYYHLAAFVLKSPLLVVFGAVFAMGTWTIGQSRGRYAECLFVPIVVIFASNALFNSLQIGVRHVLPAYPLFFIAMSPWVAAAASSWRDSIAHTVRAGVVVLLGVWMLWGTLSVAPRYLQYFSPLAGGADGGHRYLIDSNIDWGQDLLRLADYVEENSLDGVYLAYFGRVDPRVYGIPFVPLEKDLPQRGKAVVSATFLMGRPYFWYRSGRMGWVPAETYAWMRGKEPIDRVGSMFVYDLE